MTSDKYEQIRIENMKRANGAIESSNQSNLCQ